MTTTADIANNGWSGHDINIRPVIRLQGELRTRHGNLVSTTRDSLGLNSKYSAAEAKQPSNRGAMYSLLRSISDSYIPSSKKQRQPLDTSDNTKVPDSKVMVIYYLSFSVRLIP